MSDILIGTAYLECCLCHNKKYVDIYSAKENYGHDYAALMHMGHVCDKEKKIIGRYDVKYIRFSEHVDIVNDKDIVSFIHPPLQINWKVDEEDKNVDELEYLNKNTNELEKEDNDS